ncbi:mannose-1-phosphate guanylyltransferase [Qipengyuania flava]|uniref:mannose-1-phosphate guanylyltransferase n=1 Tax=Qipengyuania flava TaxID=192812 RepID=UPI000B8BCD55|nr:sugar phosphate nucleotidyltransferase [Qipengyuania flava]ASP31048.1 mannose-1-phosphate guanylyltransferase [Qipengyuania flava]
MTTIHPVILCGGGGTRLWPKSRLHIPKPFQVLTGESTLFEQALARVSGPDFAKPIVIAGKPHVDFILKQAGRRGVDELIVEPEAKNTAPAIALAAARLDPQTIMLVCPSDHYIADVEAFHSAIGNAVSLAEAGWLVTMGINPTAPETGFGYIERGEELGTGAFRVERFVEKPDRSTAHSFLKRGTFSWNSGIFVFRAGDFLQELSTHRPEMAKAIGVSVAEGSLTSTCFHPAATPFAAIAGESIDYAVMENAKKVAVVPVSMGWSDIGNWQALHDAQVKDESGNASNGQSELVDCENVFTMSDGPRVSAVGLKDVVIVVDGGEVLVLSTASAQKVGQLKGAKGQ